MEEEKNTAEKEKVPSITNKNSDGSPNQLGWAFFLIESVKNFLSISFIFKFIILVFVFFICIEGTTNYFYFQRLEKKILILSELKKQATDKVNIEKSVDKELNDIASEMAEYQTNKPEIEIVTKYLSNTLLPTVNVTDTTFSLVSADKRLINYSLDTSILNNKNIAKISRDTIDITQVNIHKYSFKPTKTLTIVFYIFIALIVLGLVIAVFQAFDFFEGLLAILGCTLLIFLLYHLFKMLVSSLF